MMGSGVPVPYLAVLDVGHGNSAVLVDRGGTVVFDAGPGSALLEFLVRAGINHVKALFLSHADRDHVAGLVAVLGAGTVRVDAVRVNSDAEKGSAIWDDLLFALEDARRRGGLDFDVSLTVRESGRWDAGDVRIAVNSPMVSQTRGGRRGFSEDGGDGSPKNAIMPSPMNLSSVPPCAKTTSTMRVR